METINHPVPGTDYPRTFQEFDKWFIREENCREYLQRLRWPDGFECPRCARKNEPWITARGLLHCPSCQGQTSVTAGTVFEGTRKPLRTWFLVMWFVTSQKNGASALGLQRALGLKSYRTAWTWLHKLRRAMVRPEHDRLQGVVEVGEIHVGGPAEGPRTRETGTGATVIVAVEKGRRDIGRVRLGQVDEVDDQRLLSFIESAVEPGSELHTDGRSGYPGIRASGYRCKTIGGERTQGLSCEPLPGVRWVALLLTRWLGDTHQGNVRKTHLDYYLDEFTFRFNGRRPEERGLLFYRLVQQAGSTGPAPYKTLVGGRSANGPADGGRRHA